MRKIKVYTDGACSNNPGVGGWAAVIIFPKTKKETIIAGYEENTTSNRMELKAVIETIKMLFTICAKIDIYTDSAYVYNAIKKKWLKRWVITDWKTSKGTSVKNQDLWNELYILLKNRREKVRIIKVKGHAGNYYNEKADRIAKRQILKNRGV
jgi:ribonuclease HI